MSKKNLIRQLIADNLERKLEKMRKVSRDKVRKSSLAKLKKQYKDIAFLYTSYLRLKSQKFYQPTDR